MLSDPQLRLLRSLVVNGWPAELLVQLLNRCGATAEEMEQLIRLSLVHTSKKPPRYLLTPIGKKRFNKEKKGRYF